MIDTDDAATWRLRGPDGVVHWLCDFDIRMSARTRCDRSCANVYDLANRPPWLTQPMFVDDAVTCIACLDAGPEPPYVETYGLDYDTGRTEREGLEEDDADEP